VSEFNVLSTKKKPNHFHEIKKIEPKIKKENLVCRGTIFFKPAKILKRFPPRSLVEISPPTPPPKFCDVAQVAIVGKYKT